jgi:hypothetical protein
LIHSLSEIAQIVLAVVGILALGGTAVAAIYAYRQVKAFTTFELLRVIERPDLRISRRIVMLEITKDQRADWWDHDPRLESAAADVCAAFDILGTLTGYGHVHGRLPWGYGKFFEQSWANTIFMTHKALEGYLEYRRKTNPNAYQAFSKLAESARTCL